MNSPDSKNELTYTGVRVHSSDIMVVSTVVDELEEKEVDHSLVFIRSAGQWTKKAITHPVIALCSVAEPELQLFCVCATGEVIVGSRAGFQEEIIDPSLI